MRSDLWRERQRQQRDAEAAATAARDAVKAARRSAAVAVGRVADRVRFTARPADMAPAVVDFERGWRRRLEAR